MTTEAPIETTPPEPSEVKRASGGLSALAIDVLVVVIVSLAMVLLVLKFGPALGLTGAGGKSEPQFLVANVEALAREEMLALGDLVRKGEITPAEMPAKTEKFSDELIKALQTTADETGKVVLRKDSLVAAPETVLDLTDEIRAKLIKSGAMQQPADAKDKP
ncbi:TrbI F-type domain-containing protein [Acidovorax sp. sic0104]|uniref:TrbI F-type domain-containing protein n=1 Tax=Acidovorax sp. sic0104 TaxID=2854784 RepID=UPI001C46D3AD|nr:TrbI F-type domain-containing protein [Acidovorax sp. sic0104]MBV7542107.1 TrbI F-type domain-containing protein [Acidovorax sp. sic0104]